MSQFIIHSHSLINYYEPIYNSQPLLITIQFKSIMFSQTSSAYKSQPQSKGKLLHDSLATQDRARIKKSIRFANSANLLKNLLNNKNLFNAQFILDLQVEEAQSALSQMLHNRQLTPLACCLIELQHRPHIVKEFPTIVTRQFMEQLVEITQQMMYLPEVTAIYKCLCSQSTQFHQVILQKKQVISNIIKEIQNMKGGHSHEVYLQILEEVCPSYSKRYQHDTNWLFNTIFELIENQSIPLLPGVNILKSLSPFINEQIHFHQVTIQRLLNEYELRMHNAGQVDVLESIFLILTKVIYYTQNTDIVSCWRIVQLILHASQTLKAKVIYGFYNAHLLLSKLIQKIANFQLYQLSNSKVPALLQLLIEEHKVDYYKPENTKISPVTTLLVNHLLTHTSLLHLQQYCPSYLYLFVTMAKYCNLQTLMDHFVRSNFVQFLADCVDHICVEVCGLALEIFVLVLQNENQNSQTLEKIKQCPQLMPLFHRLLYSSQNSVIVKDITFILQKFDHYSCQY